MPQQVCLTSDSLGKALIALGTDVTVWGKAESKTINDLWQELQKKECRILLEASGPVRETIAVVADISERENPSRGQLRELEQTLKDGRTRKRDVMPGGHAFIDEPPASCLARELEEEIGLLPGQYGFSLINMFIEVKDSPSYPGLPTRYFKHVFKVFLGTSCPDVIRRPSFERKDFEDGTTHLFGWMPAK